MGANEIFQGAGEQIQKYRNLGGQRGGGATEGIGLETQAHVMALNPFLTLEQSRAIMQAGLTSGFTGKEYETITHMMAENLKDMNMSASDSMQLFTDTVVKGGQSVKQFEGNMHDLLDYTRTGYVGRDEKIEQTKQLSAATAALGITGDVQQRYIRNATEGYADNPILAHTMTDTMTAAAGSDMYTTMAGRAAGLGGELPGVVRRKLSRMDPDKAAAAMEQPLMEAAQRAYASSRGDEDRAIVIFQNFASEITGKQMEMPEAEQLYRRLMAGKGANAAASARESDIRQGDPNIFGRVASSVGGVFKRAGQLLGIGGDNRMEDQESGTTMGGMQGPVDPNNNAFVSGGRPRPQIPSTPTAGPLSVTTNGQVQGTLVVTVDQQTGKVSAPPTIRLTGTQQSVNAGGGGTLNNRGPGQPPPGNGMS